jgi:hypothetical protein
MMSHAVLAGSNFSLVFFSLSRVTNIELSSLSSPTLGKSSLTSLSSHHARSEYLYRGPSLFEKLMVLRPLSFLSKEGSLGFKGEADL